MAGMSAEAVAMGTNVERNSRAAPGGPGSAAAATGGMADRIPVSVLTRLLRHAVVGPDAEQHTTITPFTGTAAASVPLSTERDVEAAFTMARRAQQEWVRRTPRDRAAVL